MKVYLFNNNFNEQSSRQMETTMFFLEKNDIILNEKWNKHFDYSAHITFMDFKEFMKLSEEKAILFFDIFDGYKLRKYQSKNIHFVFRPRGVIPEESFYRNKKYIRKTVLDYIEKKAIRSADYIIFLNEKQKEHFLFKYDNKLYKLKQTSVLPNIKKANTHLLNSIELKAPKDEEIKLVYSGGFSKWQNIESVFELVSNINKNNKLKCTFTILTFKENFKEAERLALKYQIQEKLNIKYITPDRLDEELKTHDVGIIIRDKNIVNSAASPFKIVDYISNGLGLILSDAIASQAEEVIDSSYLYILNYENKEIKYSEGNLEHFLLKMKDSKNKEKIVRNYTSKISEIKTYKLEEVYRK